MGLWVNVLTAPVDEEIAFWHRCRVSDTSTSFRNALDEAASHFSTFIPVCGDVTSSPLRAPSLAPGRAALICVPVDADNDGFSSSALYLKKLCAVEEDFI